MTRLPVMDSSVALTFLFAKEVPNEFRAATNRAQIDRFLSAGARKTLSSQLELQ